MTELTDHDRLTQIHAVLIGVNGNPGLVKLVDRNTRSIQKLWLAIIIIATSIGGGVYGIIEILRGI
uniref:Uncharacterized protein n=1 Tax=viral metagenome TaxID=1070528 RepID=A0A6H1ZT39_9ZZZZ